MKTKLLVFMLVVIALTGGFAVRATREAERTKAATRELAAERANLRRMIVSAKEQLRMAEDTLARVEQNPGQTLETKEARAGANATAAKPATPARRFPPGAAIANAPRKLAEYARNFRASLDHTYGGMFKALGLSAEQREKLKDLKVWLEEQRMDLNAAIELQSPDSPYYQRMLATARAVNDLTVLPLDPNSKEFGPLAKAWHKTRMAKEDELLGALVAPYREYYRAGAVRYLAVEMAGTAILSGEPVASTQVERTAQVLAANSQRGSTGNVRGWVMPNTVNWDAASTELQGVLSPSQIATLGSLIQRDAMQAALNQQIALVTAQFKGLLPPR